MRDKYIGNELERERVYECMKNIEIERDLRPERMKGLGLQVP